MHVLPRATACVAVIAAAGIVAACSSSGSAKSDNTGATPPATTTVAPSSTVSTTAAGTLAKADFVSKANALCASTYPKVHPGPAPTSATDYVATAKYAQVTLDEFPPFSQKAKALVARSADKDELTAKWIAVDEADVAAEKPLLQQLIAAANAHEEAKVQQIEDQLGSAPDHSEQTGTYLTSYGLTECAKLETS